MKKRKMKETDRNDNVLPRIRNTLQIKIWCKPSIGIASESHKFSTIRFRIKNGIDWIPRWGKSFMIKKDENKQSQNYTLEIMEITSGAVTVQWNARWLCYDVTFLFLLLVLKQAAVLRFWFSRLNEQFSSPCTPCYDHHLWSELILLVFTFVSLKLSSCFHCDFLVKILCFPYF